MTMMRSRCVACKHVFKHDNDGQQHELCEPCRLRLSGRTKRVKRAYRTSNSTVRKDTFEQRIQQKVQYVLEHPTYCIKELKQFNNIKEDLS
jgi:hypothetical protein